MSHQCSGRSPLRTTSTAFVLLTSVFTLLTHSCEGQSQMIGPSKPSLALIGDDVTLPCYLEPSSDVTAKTLEWSRPVLNPRFVHVRRDGMELFVNQNPSYVGRTSVSNARLKHGDISLQLSNVKLSDAGSYQCFIPSMGSSKVELVVGALSSAVVTVAEIDKAVSRAVLDCESKGWYPEPEVSWLDGEGHVLSAGPPETVRGPDGLYTVSSRVTVEERDGNRFTCRVHQKTIDQTRETEVRILEDVFKPSSYCFAIRLAVVFSVVLLLCCVPAGLFLKRRCDESRPAPDRTGDDAEETEELNKEHLDGEKLQEKEEDKREMQHVISELETQEKEEDEMQNMISVLETQEKEEDEMQNMISVLKKQEKELQTSIVTHVSQLKKLVKQKNKIVEEFEKINSKSRGDNESKVDSLTKDKEKLEIKEREHKEYLQRTTSRRLEIKELIDRIIKCKNNFEKEINQIREQLARLQSQQ